jgi:hypothetical protein
MAKLYRIYTQWKDNLGDLAVKYFPDGFTIYRGTGYWKGGREENATIEIALPEPNLSLVQDLAKEIKTVNHQEAILTVVQDLDHFILR